MSPIIVSAVPWEEREKIKAAVYSLTIERDRSPVEVEYNYIAVIIGRKLNDNEKLFAEKYWKKNVKSKIDFLNFNE